MKLVKFKGGLGNQLFQYSLIRNFEIKYNLKHIKGDFSYFNDINNDTVRLPRIKKLKVNITIASKEDVSEICKFKKSGNPLGLKYKSKIYFEKTFNKKYYFESDRSYRDLSTLLNYNYYDGYWQSWKYVEEIEDNLRKEIQPNFELSSQTKKIIAKMENENSVFIGIRRGDYLTTKKDINHYGSYSINYYLKAIEYIKKNVDNPIFYVFSNDITWVKENLDFKTDVIYRDDKEQTSDVEELFIMGTCKHAIIVNSSFYWWGAWLIENQDKIVIAPNNWFADGSKIDILPQNWIKI